MSATPNELADRLDRCATLIRLANGALDPELLEKTAAELRSLEAQQPPNVLMLDALRSVRRRINEEVANGGGIFSKADVNEIEAAIAAAEAAPVPESADVDALSDARGVVEALLEECRGVSFSHEERVSNAEQWLIASQESRDAIPESAGLANPAKDAGLAAAVQIANLYAIGIIYECGTGSLPIARNVIAKIIENEVLAAYESRNSGAAQKAEGACPTR